MSDLAKIEALAASFPCLARAEGVKPFDPDRLKRWSSRASSGEAHASRFLLGVWSGGRSTPPFLLLEAMNVWDSGQRAAFAAWAQAPWTR